MKVQNEIMAKSETLMGKLKSRVDAPVEDDIRIVAKTQELR